MCAGQSRKFRCRADPNGTFPHATNLRRLWQRREKPHRKLPEVGAIDVAIAVDVAEEVEEALKHQDLLSRRFGLGTKQHDRRSWFWRVENSAGAFNYLSS